jgi:soluble lytic murein transglycosylase
MSSTDPADYIECIPFSETRDYVMRVMEGMQVYRARLAGGTGKLTLPVDLKRGGYGYSSRPTALSAPAPSSLTSR